MGCGLSKFDSNAADSVPIRILPLLRRRFQEMRLRHRNRASLRISHTRLSKKKLLKDGASDHDTIFSLPRESDGKNISSVEDNNLKASPKAESEETTITNGVENDPKAAKETPPVLSCVKVAPAPEPEKLTGDKSMKWDDKKEEAMAKAAIVAGVKSIKTAVDNAGKEQGKEEDKNEEDIGRMKSIHAEGVCPGSPSFRVYFIESLANIEDDDGKSEFRAD